MIASNNIQFIFAIKISNNLVFNKFWIHTFLLKRRLMQMRQIFWDFVTLTTAGFTRSVSTTTATRRGY